MTAKANADKILTYLARETEYPPTAKEIAEAVGATPGSVSSALRRLADEGKVEKLGVAMDGGRTWVLVRN